MRWRLEGLWMVIKRLHAMKIYHAIPGVPLRSTPGFNPVAPSALTAE